MFVSLLSAGANLNGQFVTSTCPDIRLGQRLVRLDEPLSAIMRGFECRSKAYEARNGSSLKAQTLLFCATQVHLRGKRVLIQARNHFVQDS